MTERRQNQESCCPDHPKEMRARENDTIICLVYGCNWNIPARRKLDEQIETFETIRAKWR